jgi:hypothetical protein
MRRDQCRHRDQRRCRSQTKSLAKANINGNVMSTVTTSATSAFQHDDSVNLNAHIHEIKFRDRIHHFNLAFVITITCVTYQWRVIGMATGTRSPIPRGEFHH